MHIETFDSKQVLIWILGGQVPGAADGVRVRAVGGRPRAADDAADWAAAGGAAVRAGGRRYIMNTRTFSSADP